MTAEKPGADLGTYELRVQGELGPLLLSVLPHSAVICVPRHSVLVLNAGPGHGDLLEIVRLVVAAGLEIESVHRSLGEQTACGDGRQVDA